MKLKFISLLSLLTASLGLYAAEPAGYYDSCEGKCGKALLKALENVISKHTNVGYDGLWNVYDDSDVREDGSVWDMYSTKDWGKNWHNYINRQYSNVGDGLNREHSFPKSWFSKGSPMNSDAFHIYPTDGYVNNQRSNYPYGECTNGEVKKNGSVVGLGRLGSCTYPGYNGTVFEPDDQYKGDFARTYFYMAACYNSKIAGWNSPCLAGNDYPAFKDWSVTMFLDWDKADKVSQKEIDRNDAVYKHQHNRNPFIDHPELALHIWGSKKSEPWYASGNPNPNPEPDPEPDPKPDPEPDPEPFPGTFLETFEPTGSYESYSAKEYVGSVATWSTDCYFTTKSDQAYPYEGAQAARTNKTGTGFLEMITDKANGAGTITFYAHRWHNAYTTDDEATFTISVSNDKGANWKKVSDVSVTATDYALHKVTANVEGNVRLRFEQTAGKRVLIDNVGITDYESVGAWLPTEEIEIEQPVYYNLQGMPVANPEHGVYIRVIGTNAVKIIL